MLKFLKRMGISLGLELSDKVRKEGGADSKASSDLVRKASGHTQMETGSSFLITHTLRRKVGPIHLEGIP